MNYLLAIFMMYAGIATAFAPLDETVDSFGWIYGSRPALVLFGIIFFVSGASLFVGKILKHASLIGHSLMAIYLCFLFGAFLQGAAHSWVDGLPNFIASGIVAVLYLRWKYKYHPVPIKE